jgi:SAM-dependent methyltransferase
MAGLRATRAPYAGFCDLDLSAPLEELRRILHTATRGPLLAIGSRDLAGSNLVRPEPRVREALGRIYNRLVQATVTPGIVDTQCGAKVASREVWDSILPHCQEIGFAWDAEAIGVALALGISVQEVPIEWRHDVRSRVRVIRDGGAMVFATPRIVRSVQRARADRVVKPPADDGAEVFADENARRLLEADSEHWWFRSKAALVSTALRRTSSTGGGWLVDAGGGAGGVTARLGWAPERAIVMEGNADLAYAASHAHGLRGVRANVGQFPLAPGSTDVVCLLDVIEHLTDPVATLREAADAITPRGRVVVNVPAHSWLWSAADEELGHVKRYTRPMLRKELAAAGLDPVLITHVFSYLVPPVWLKRKVVSTDNAELGLDQQSGLIDRAAMVLTLLERQLLGRIPLPFGTSVLCIAELVEPRVTLPS